MGAGTAFTVGYAGRTISEFIAVLKRARVSRVVDVRALPLSRRKGFSKTSLGQALLQEGIEYVHVREAGNPFREMKNEIQKCLARYARHLDRNPNVLERLNVVLKGRRAALLCVEAEACDCHRSILSERLARRGTKIVDL